MSLVYSLRLTSCGPLISVSKFSSSQDDWHLDSWPREEALCSVRRRRPCLTLPRCRNTFKHSGSRQQIAAQQAAVSLLVLLAFWAGCKLPNLRDFWMSSGNGCSGPPHLIALYPSSYRAPSPLSQCLGPGESWSSLAASDFQSKSLFPSHLPVSLVPLFALWM